MGNVYYLTLRFVPYHFNTKKDLRLRKNLPLNRYVNFPNFVSNMVNLGNWRPLQEISFWVCILFFLDKCSYTSKSVINSVFFIFIYMLFSLHKLLFLYTSHILFYIMLLLILLKYHCTSKILFTLLNNSIRIVREDNRRVTIMFVESGLDTRNLGGT